MTHPPDQLHGQNCNGWQDTHNTNQIALIDEMHKPNRDVASRNPGCEIGMVPVIEFLNQNFTDKGNRPQ